MNTEKQASFSAGEIAPSLYARSDLARYTTGLKTCRNFMTMRQGGVQNRSGTSYVCEVKDSSKTVRLIDWVFNSEQSYILEFGDLYMRIIKDGAPLEVSGVSAWSNVTAYVVGDLASRLGVNYYCILAHTNQQPPNATYWYPLTGDIFEIPTPYVEADLPELNYAQSADVMTIVQKNYAPRELSRFAETNWTLSTITYGPSIDAPANFARTGGTAGFAKESWWVTSVNLAGEESLASKVTSNTRAAAGAGIISLDWDADADAVEYRLYKKINPSDGLGGYDAGYDASDLITGLIARLTSNSYEDDGTPVPDPTYLPTNTTARNPFSTTGDYPGAVIYSQQRRIFASSGNNSERVWASYTGSFANFENYQNIPDSNSVQFDLVGRQVNEVRHLIEARQLLALTIGSEWAINGNDAGGLTPTTINAKQQTFNGSSYVRPINTNNQILHVQARGSTVRLLGFDLRGDGYDGSDLTIYSAHLFDNYTLSDWAYQQIPNSIIWIVRSDGTLLGLTYIKEQEMIAWHRHDFENGIAEVVCSIPEGNEDALYVVVKRTIDGGTVRYIERMNTRQVEDIVDSVFMDSALSYDGRNETATTMTISGGTSWDQTETQTLTASASFFVAGDVGNSIFMTAADGSQLRLSIEGYTSVTVVTVRPHRTIPTDLRNSAKLVWSKAVDELSGLDHLEGESVSVIGDGFVVASPNNASYTEIVVSSGAITLPTPRAVIHVGLPITSDLKTLDIDTPSGETLSDKKKLITAVSMFVEASRGIWVGGDAPSDDSVDPLEDLDEIPLRDQELYDEPTELKTEVVNVNIKGGWTKTGSVFIRQVDPLPLTVLSIVPTGMIPRVG